MSNNFSNDNLKSFSGSNLPYAENSHKWPPKNINHDSSWKSWLNRLSNMSWSELIHECRNSRRLVLLVVFIALFFDNMLLTTVVPIIPEYLFELDHPNESFEFMTEYRMQNLSKNYDVLMAPFLQQYNSPSDKEHQKMLRKNWAKIEEEEKVKIARDSWKTIQMNKLNTKVGLMFASKPVVQLIANPFIGPLTNK